MEIEFEQVGKSRKLAAASVNAYERIAGCEAVEAAFRRKLECEK
jgi:hypothetical protein